MCCIFLYERTFFDYLSGCLQPDLCPLPSGKTNKSRSMSPDGLFIVIRIVNMRSSYGAQNITGDTFYFIDILYLSITG